MIGEISQASWYTILLREALSEASSVAEAVAAADLAFAMQSTPPEDGFDDVLLAVEVQEELDAELASGVGLPVGKPWRGPSGRMFVKKEVKGKIRTVPYKDDEASYEGTKTTHPGPRWRHPRRKEVVQKAAVQTPEQAKTRLDALGKIENVDQKNVREVTALLREAANEIKSLTGKELQALAVEMGLTKSGVKQEVAMRLAGAALRKAREKDKEKPSTAPVPPPYTVPKELNINGRAEDKPYTPKGVKFENPPSEKVTESIRQMFGMDVKPEDLAGSSNAVDGAILSFIDMTDYGIDGMMVQSTGSDVFADRLFKRRDDGTLEVHNDIFQTSESSPYKGQGAALFLNQVRSLRALGVSVISTYAVGDLKDATSGKFNGYITWPKFGYDGLIPQRILDKLPPGYVSAMSGDTNLQSLMELPGGSEVWELYGSNIDLEFDLSDNSQSMQVLNSYLERRRSRPDATRQQRPSTEPSEVRYQRRRAELEEAIRSKSQQAGIPYGTA